MKLLVAVSGGVDSVVLLDTLTRTEHEIVVAHFEHGIRGEQSRADQAFVEQLAAQYNLPFVTTNAALGASVSEAMARTARYEFLRSEAKKHQATIATAHHADDIIETIAINLTRGTGWRGLAVLDSDIYRPLLHTTKSEIIADAKVNSLQWREDSTNHTDVYLRNRLRRKLIVVDDDAKLQLLALREVQVALKRQIDELSHELLDSAAVSSRDTFRGLDDTVADELLRALCVRDFAVAPARPARARMLAAIRELPPAKLHQSTDGIDVVITKRQFSLRHRSD